MKSNKSMGHKPYFTASIFKREKFVLPTSFSRADRIKFVDQKLRRCKQIKGLPQQLKFAVALKLFWRFFKAPVIRLLLFWCCTKRNGWNIGIIGKAVSRGGFRTQTGRRIPYSALFRSKFVLRSMTAFCGSKNDNLAPPAALRLAASRTKPHTKQKSPPPMAMDFSVWQGQADSNPRPTVLEWLWMPAKPWESSIFRTFQHLFRTKPCVTLVSENLWCFFDAIRKYRLPLLPPAWFWCFSKLKIWVAVSKEIASMQSYHPKALQRTSVAALKILMLWNCVAAHGIAIISIRENLNQKHYKRQAAGVSTHRPVIISWFLSNTFNFNIKTQKFVLRQGM